MIKRRKIIIITSIVLFLQFLQIFSGRDLLIGFSSYEHGHFIIKPKEIPKTQYVYLSIPNPFKSLSYRISIGKFTAWGDPDSLAERQICLIGHHFYPEQEFKNIRQCVGISIIKIWGYIID